MNIATGQIVQSTATIASGQTTSSTITTEGLALCGIFIPSSFTGTSISFLACATATGTFVPVKNAGSSVSQTVAASQYIAIDPTLFQGMPYLQIVSNASEGANRALICSMKGTM